MNLPRDENGIPLPILHTRDGQPVDSSNPLSVQVVGGGGGTSQIITATLPPQALTVSTNPVALTIPAGATHATVHIVSGSVRRSIGGVPGAGTSGLSAGDSEEVSGAELTAYRLVREGATDAQVYVEYRTVG